MAEPKTVCLCDVCGVQLLLGDLCWRINGLCVCRDCLPACVGEDDLPATEMTE